MSKRLAIFLSILIALAVVFAFLILLAPTTTQSLLNEIVSEKAQATRPLLHPELIKLMH